MIYLNSFTFPDGDEEFDFFRLNVKRTCYDSFYPFGQVAKKEISILNFEDVTILYGGNGSGKTTILNVIAEKVNLKRESVYNRSNFFPDYIALCDASLERDIPEHSRIITSDDVFDYMLGVRTLNEGIDTKREELYQEYLDAKYSDFHYRTMEDFERLKQVNLARRKTQSKYVRENLMDNIREHSNGENAFRYFQEKVEESALYLLDEPENSLSPERQLELVKFIEEAAKYLNCQFIISTHSPFLLGMKGAKIYDLDTMPVRPKKWTQLKNVQLYYQFFKERQSEFD
ncbi:MAG: AAA family ATPase [Lachnospiraceae bacterium]|nr:AAA family ATPase [Lachnospiraceae bacterium]